MSDLLDIMAKLRDPDTGCPWDIEQDFKSIAPYTIEEAYEVDEAIRNDDMSALRDELGDLLFQTVFHSQMASEAGHFTFDDIVENISDKMIRRHPHVFGGGTIEDADAQTNAWETQKAKERKEKAEKEGRTPSALDGVSISLPATQRAVKLQKRAARVGFDWPETLQVLDKLEEETRELIEATSLPNNTEHIEEEFGDLMFVMCNLARHLKIDPEEALRTANAKFTRRFNGVESELQKLGKTPEQSTLDEMDALWDKVKEAEKSRP
ncbi:nucleoside triphosphate pyrophosphohydrolase [Kordiimonas sp. SCSIO 12610]|nr:nucleoside triphosphate pyrophosphohydrolase [Kordiimonas sp. SCSIO 12610]